MEEERIIEQITTAYNDYLYECWIDPNDTKEWLKPTAYRDIEYINEKSEVCYKKINELYNKFGTAP
ncbi:hypothetical protein D3C76_1311510 [compost metagenome]